MQGHVARRANLSRSDDGLCLQRDKGRSSEYLFWYITEIMEKIIMLTIPGNRKSTNKYLEVYILLEKGHIWALSQLGTSAL